jgi:fimbrial chaperone protein
MLRLFALLMLLAPLQAFAGDWRVVPIRLFLDQKTRSDSVRLINSGAVPLTLQVSAARWTQNAQGEDQYQSSDELIFFPRVLTVPPGEERILRAGIKQPLAEQEHTYRLFIEEIPEPQPTGSSSVQIAVRFGLPVFVAPQQPKPAAQIDVLTLVSGSAEVRLSNTGNRHLLPTTLAYKGLAADGRVVFTHPVQPWYLLPGTIRTFKQPLSADECRQTSVLRFELGADDLHLVRDLPATPGACAP